MIRFIQVGIGVRGSHWARVLRERPDVSVAAYIDLRVDLARQRAIEWGQSEVPCFADLETALNTIESDVVLLATPPEVHHAQALLAFEHGQHVLCEKPLAENLAEGIDIVRQAELHGRKLMVGMNFRYLPVTQSIRQVIQARRFGAPGYGHFVYLRNRDGRRADLNKYPLTMAYPMLLEQSIHHFDLLRYAYGREVQALSSASWRPAWSTYANDCCVSALLRFEGGLHVNYMGTWTTGWNGFQFQWRTDLPGGVIVQDSMWGDLKIGELNPQLALQGKLNKGPDEVEPLQMVPLPPLEQYIDDTKGLLNEFVQALANQRPLETSGQDHLKTLALVLACIESTEMQRWVDLPDFYARNAIPERWL